METNPCQTQIWQPKFQVRSQDIVHDDEDLIECLGEVEEDDMIDSLEEVDDDEAIDEDNSVDNSVDNDSKDHGTEDRKGIKTNGDINHVEYPDIFELNSEEEDVALPLTFNCREDQGCQTEIL